MRRAALLALPIAVVASCADGDSADEQAATAVAWASVCSTVDAYGGQVVEQAAAVPQDQALLDSAFTGLVDGLDLDQASTPPEVYTEALLLRGTVLTERTYFLQSGTMSNMTLPNAVVDFQDDHCSDS